MKRLCLLAILVFFSNSYATHGNTIAAKNACIKWLPKAPGLNAITWTSSSVRIGGGMYTNTQNQHQYVSEPDNTSLILGTEYKKGSDFNSIIDMSDKIYEEWNGWIENSNSPVSRQISEPEYVKALNLYAILLTSLMEDEAKLIFIKHINQSTIVVCQYYVGYRTKMNY